MVVKAEQGGAEMLGWHKLKPALFAADLNPDNGSVAVAQRLVSGADVGLELPG